MISTQRTIYCPNLDCNQPINSVGDRFCANCQTPLIHRYLWSTKVTPRTKVADRYEVITQQIWLDTQPGIPPEVPAELPAEVIPYLQLYPERLHLPQAYGFVDNILLLENVPIDEGGQLYPTITQAWDQATAVRQVYWLWQILQLWNLLAEVGVAQSLLYPDNLRVQGWCVRLLALHQTTDQPTLADLGQSWLPWVATAKIELQPIVQQLSNPKVKLEAITKQLNHLLLSLVAELPLTLKIAGATDTGRELTQNEDTCYPYNPEDVDEFHLMIICDGIGGHEGGEVASQLAVRLLKLQMQALLAEVAAQTELVSPDLLMQQIEASLRVVNNVIWSRNYEQKRQGTERMATTLVMAVQIPQRVHTISGRLAENAHELYLVSIGDSRAYWITHDHCQLLTIDDDIAAREVRSGRSLYRQALQRPDAVALTQALGTKDAESLRFSIQRLILEEDGLLLLCSDGLSDNNLVEQSWPDYALPVLRGELTLEDATQNWINLANQTDGHDNTSIVLLLCRVSPEPLVLAEIPVDPAGELELYSETESSLDPQELDLIEEPTLNPTQPQSSQGISWLLLGGLSLLLVGAISLGIFAWWQLKQPTSQRCWLFPQGQCRN